MISELLNEAEATRLRAMAAVDAETQGNLGQYFTPRSAASLLASMPRLPAESTEWRVLDPGAGSGMLSAALAARVLVDAPQLALHVVAVERDEMMLPYLYETLDACKSASEGSFTYEVLERDFIMTSSGLDADSRLTDFDLIIQNPPYAKLAASSSHRQALRAIGVDVPNLYAAFLALSAVALRNGGQLVAITPRSFFNGPYFGDFRSFLLGCMSLDRVHVFQSRSRVFSDTGVLQENVIFSGTRGARSKKVALSTSDSHQDEPSIRTVRYSEVVNPRDPHQFIRLTPRKEDARVTELMFALPASMADLDVQVSTGRVVDFRARRALRTEAVKGSFPLIYPGNLRGGVVEWPRRDLRKAQWFEPAEPRELSLLLPEGWYCIVKRFSAKEERRRVVAAVWSPSQSPGPVAFENHVNVFHTGGKGLDEATARGLCIWLNSSLVDQFFRTFSGHTQVNATDLKTLRFPNLDGIHRLGQLCSIHDQEAIDVAVAEVVGVSL